MDSKKSNKISEIVRLQQILKKWKKLANINNNIGPKNTSSNGSIEFLKKKKKTVLSNIYSNDDDDDDDVVVVPKGFLAVCVGKELKRFIIPTEYLSHRAFGILLREAEEEFGFQQEGVLKIPCEVPLFQNILKLVQHKRSDLFFLHHHYFTTSTSSTSGVQ